MLDSFAKITAILFSAVFYVAAGLSAAKSDWQQCSAFALLAIYPRLLLLTWKDE